MNENQEFQSYYIKTFYLEINEPKTTEKLQCSIFKWKSPTPTILLPNRRPLPHFIGFHEVYILGTTKLWLEMIIYDHLWHTLKWTKLELNEEWYFDHFRDVHHWFAFVNLHALEYMLLPNAAKTAFSWAPKANFVCKTYFSCVTNINLMWKHIVIHQI